ncbi:hypothetical protein [Nitrosopumilus cobalaminigenes]|nr:hypothetical protein [Nitrosopumilus cobalaminigenes]
MNKLVFFISLLVLLNFPTSFAEPNEILITFSDTMEQVEFDGKWTFGSEWKASSLETFGVNKIRMAHQGDFIYVMINQLSDTTYNKGSDKAMICFDTINDKSVVPNEDDYCFIAILEGKSVFTLQGGSPFPFTSYYNKIINHDDLLAIGTMSDGNDRYSKIPHTTYEFKIPIEIFGRNNVYGFYLETFDASNGQSYSWPEVINKTNSIKIPPPNLWGEIISIDKSLPEFPLPFVVFTIMFLSVIILSKKLNYGRLRINIH